MARGVELRVLGLSDVSATPWPRPRWRTSFARPSGSRLELPALSDDTSPEPKRESRVFLMSLLDLGQDLAAEHHVQDHRD